MPEDTMTPTLPTPTARDAVEQMVRQAQAELEAARNAERVAAEAAEAVDREIAAGIRRRLAALTAAVANARRAGLRVTVAVDDEWLGVDIVRPIVVR